MQHESLVTMSISCSKDTCTSILPIIFLNAFSSATDIENHGFVWEAVK